MLLRTAGWVPDEVKAQAVRFDCSVVSRVAVARQKFEFASEEVLKNCRVEPEMFDWTAYALFLSVWPRYAFFYRAGKAVGPTGRTSHAWFRGHFWPNGTSSAADSDKRIPRFWNPFLLALLNRFTWISKVRQSGTCVGRLSARHVSNASPESRTFIVDPTRFSGAEYHRAPPISTEIIGASIRHRAQSIHPPRESKKPFQIRPSAAFLLLQSRSTLAP
jgi:hypothetical protein